MKTTTKSIIFFVMVGLTVSLLLLLFMYLLWGVLINFYVVLTFVCFGFVIGLLSYLLKYF